MTIAHAGSTAEWIIAWATTVAAVGTVGVLLLTGLVFRRQLQQERVSQARRVSARKEEDHIGVHNGSDQPIYLVMVWFSDIGLARYEPRPANVSYDYVGPGESVRFSSQPILEADLWHSVLHELRFTDSAGNRWLRHRWGALWEVEPIPLAHTAPRFILEKSRFRAPWRRR